MSATPFEIKPVTPYCGAEVTGLDLSRDLETGTAAALHAALADHCVLFFRDQQLTPVQQKRFGARFGDLHLHPAWPRLLDGHPEIMELLFDESSQRVAGEEWHSDVSCDAEPPLGTILYMLEVPPVGGDTLFANMYRAFETLSEPLQQMLDGMSAIHDGEHVYRGRYGTDDDAGARRCS